LVTFVYYAGWLNAKAGRLADRSGRRDKMLKSGTVPPKTDVTDLKHWNVKILKHEKSGKPLLQASLPVTTYYCTENKLAERFASLKQPGQIQKGTTANQNSLLSQLILKKTSIKTSASHKTESQDSHKTQAKSHDD